MTKLIPIAAAAFLCGAFAAEAGDNNTILLIQQSPMGSTSGNTLSIDQSGANGSTVAGVGRGNPLLRGALAAIGIDAEYAVQQGEDNVAKLTLTGTGGDLRLLQSSNPILPVGAGVTDPTNTATVVARDFANGAVAQIGLGNTATMTLDENANGLVTQLGSRLTATLTVGERGNAVITQIGNNSRTPSLEVLAGATLAYTQIGDNIAPPTATPVQVISASPGPVSITQTAW
jgi:hypothetical protein